MCVVTYHNGIPYVEEDVEFVDGEYAFFKAFAITAHVHAAELPAVAKAPGEV